MNNAFSQTRYEMLSLSNGQGLSQSPLSRLHSKPFFRGHWAHPTRFDPRHFEHPRATPGGTIAVSGVAFGLAFALFFAFAWPFAVVFGATGAAFGSGTAGAAGAAPASMGGGGAGCVGGAMGLTVGVALAFAAALGAAEDTSLFKHFGNFGGGCKKESGSVALPASEGTAIADSTGLGGNDGGEAAFSDGEGQLGSRCLRHSGVALQGVIVVRNLLASMYVHP